MGKRLVLGSVLLLFALGRVATLRAKHNRVLPGAGDAVVHNGKEGSFCSRLGQKSVPIIAGGCGTAAIQSTLECSDTMIGPRWVRAHY